MHPVEIRPLATPDVSLAAGLLGRGMRDNPTHVQAFGADPARRERTLRRIFTPFLERQLNNGRVLGPSQANDWSAWRLWPPPGVASRPLPTSDAHYRPCLRMA